MISNDDWVKMSNSFDGCVSMADDTFGSFYEVVDFRFVVGTEVGLLLVVARLARLVALINMDMAFSNKGLSRAVYLSTYCTSTMALPLSTL